MHRARNLNDVLAAHLGCNSERLCALFRIDRDLCDAKPIAQIQKDQPTMIAAAVDPAGEGDFFAGIASA